MCPDAQPSPATNPDLRPELQRDVQRLLGRCLLRLQQYEHLMKAVLAHHEFAGPPNELEARLEERVSTFSGQTLGQLDLVQISGPVEQRSPECEAFQALSTASQTAGATRPWTPKRPSAN